jgi:hypothetical protein
LRAISLWQPWASAIALGSKTIETRHWSTQYRGPLAIHAAQRKVRSELQDYGLDPIWQGALHLLPPDKSAGDIFMLPFGAIVATCNLIGCLTSEEIFRCRAAQVLKVHGTFPHSWTEEMMGNLSDGRYGWILADIKPLAAPVPFKGKQGFFNVPDHLLEPV